MATIKKIACQKIAGCFSILTLLVLMVTLLSLTILREVKQTDYAVEYNTYSCEFGRILEQGKYTTDVGVELFTFKRTLQDLHLNRLTCMTSDKVEIDLDITMNIEYLQEELIPIILEQFNTDKEYATFLTSLAQSSVLNTCATYSAEEYYSERSIIASEMTLHLQQVINSDVGSTVEFFQLTNILFPANYSAMILQKQTTSQLQTTYLNDRQNQITIANTNYFVANNTAQIMIINAKQSAQTILNQANTTKLIVESFWDNRKKVYHSLLTNNFNYNVSSLVEYINAESVRNSKKLYTHA